MAIEKKIGDYLLSDDQSKLQIESVHQFLSQESYWAKNIPIEIVKESIRGSVCFGIYLNTSQIGFARVITDGATFGYLADVFVLEAHRGKGLSKALMSFILHYPAFTKLRRFMLATKDAHGLYSQFGFSPLASPERFMEIKSFETYPD
jgi:GNAT superfamily N-acetyltransferase